MIALPVTEASQVADARRRVAALAQAQALDEDASGRAALVASELATNLVKHGGGGQLLAEATPQGLVLIALDRGPGLHEARCLVDGYSTAGTLGHGLGAVRRQSDAMAFASWPGQGTALLARVHAQRVRHGAIGAGVAVGAPAPDAVGLVVVAMPGETACGDAAYVRHDERSSSYFVVDGLGHGTDAARAANVAVAQAQHSGDALPERLLDEVHRALQPTRGGAVAVARLDRAAGTVSYAGLGNIAGVLAGRDGKLRRMVSHNGTAGHNARRIQAFDYPGANGLLVMHSDGIDTRWSLDRYPGALALDPLLLAALIYRDHARGRDDATVLVARL